jgi:hypothetical protein
VCRPADVTELDAGTSLLRTALGGMLVQEVAIVAGLALHLPRAERILPTSGATSWRSLAASWNGRLRRRPHLRRFRVGRRMPAMLWVQRGAAIRWKNGQFEGEVARLGRRRPAGARGRIWVTTL